MNQQSFQASSSTRLTLTARCTSSVTIRHYPQYLRAPIELADYVIRRPAATASSWRQIFDRSTASRQLRHLRHPAVFRRIWVPLPPLSATQHKLFYSRLRLCCLLARALAGPASSPASDFGRLHIGRRSLPARHRRCWSCFPLWSITTNLALHFEPRPKTRRFTRTSRRWLRHKHVRNNAVLRPNTPQHRRIILKTVFTSPSSSTTAASAATTTECPNDRPGSHARRVLGMGARPRRDAPSRAGTQGCCREAEVGAGQSPRARGT